MTTLGLSFKLGDGPEVSIRRCREVLSELEFELVHESVLSAGSYRLEARKQKCLARINGEIVILPCAGLAGKPAGNTLYLAVAVGPLADWAGSALDLEG